MVRGRRRHRRQRQTRVNRLTYKICVLEAFRERLRSNEIWVVVGADRYHNPDEDLPADFVKKRTAYYTALGLPLDPDGFISGLQEEMRAALSQLEAGIGDQDRTVALCV